jgi:hypothetical protein
MRKTAFIAAALALALAACASTPSSPGAAKSAVARTQPPPGCVGSSAITRPPDSPQQPCAGFGSVYTKDDIDRTGATNMGDALRLLDPTLTVRGP